MEEPTWIRTHWVHVVHEDQIEQHGGSKGVRDEALLESALARARNRWEYGDEPDLAELAAAYGYGLATNHPFVDGNKRTAFLITYAFLRVNGARIDAEEPEVVDLMRGLAAGEVSESELAAWIRNHLHGKGEG